ncbi:Splicing factor 3B subunit 5 [Lobulomyces angularis]|nr:Splicing factor 3B subunit 5 [Lobulomyces angularis]
MSTALFNNATQLEHTQSKYIGTGHADTSKFEWASNIHRDTLAACAGSHSLSTYFAVAENESIVKERY